MLVKTTFLVFATFWVVDSVPANLTHDQTTVVRPCNLEDYKCIGDNLAVNSKCDQNIRGAIPPIYKMQNFKFETPYFNASYIDNNLLVRNHNKCFVSEFLFNTKTGTLVLSLDCPGLDIESDRTLMQHYSMREDKTYRFHIRGFYPLVRLTTTFYQSKNLDLCSAFTFADVTALPTFNLAPKDAPTKKFLSHDLSLLPIYEIESFFYRSKQLARFFINSLICDFKCNF